MQRLPLKDIKSVTDFITQYPSEKDVVHMLMDEKLLLDTMKCDRCGKEMKLRSRGKSYEWRCRVDKTKDCSSKSVKSGSFFSSTKLDLVQSVKILILWNIKTSSKQIAEESKCSRQTVCDYRNFLRELCVGIESDYGMIGGENHIIEIDETNIHSRKYGIGKNIGDDWVFGGLDRMTGKVFAKRVENRTAAVLVPLLQAHVDKKSTVYSDEWRSYAQLKKYFAGHFTVCHKTQFVKILADRNVCTNGIESMWARLKKPFKESNGTSSALLDSYISEFVVRENEKEAFFEKILNSMKVQKA